MEALLISTGIVALAEIGDKTQLLAFVLAARYRRPWPIVAGITLATLANHAGAAALGSWAGAALDAGWLRWVLGLGFLAMAAWVLVPDTLDDDGGAGRDRGGAFLTTLVVFFLAEMGDKTQLATVALGARFDGALVAVVVGTTAGMLLANVPAVLVGQRLAERLPLRAMRWTAAALFALVGVATLV